MIYPSSHDDLDGEPTLDEFLPWVNFSETVACIAGHAYKSLYQLV